MMQPDDAGECTPLLTAAKETLRGLQQDEGPRRRQGPQHQGLEEDDEESFFLTSPRSADVDKKDRRSKLLLGRLLTASVAVTRFFAQRSTSCYRTTREDEEEYYLDPYNDQSWNCSFGTNEDDGVWMNLTDQVGIVMAALVWLLITYSGITMNLLAQHGHISSFTAHVYLTICVMALACHAKTSFTDPGCVPPSAVPLYNSRYNSIHALCGHCQSYKPNNSHHCRICNRCISRMDHHCPWMNNCVGAGNLKHFILFLCYTWTGCALALLIFGYNYFMCNSARCQFTIVLVQLVRAMTIICICTLLFTSSMLMNITYGVMTGVGTIDRLKRKATDTLFLSEEEPVDLEDIFGISGYWTWPLPIDPVFEDYDRIMGCSTPQRLLREQLRQGYVPSSNSDPGSKRDLASF